MKTIAGNWKILKHLVWFGPMLTTAGLVAGLTSGVWIPVPLLLIIAGVSVIGLWLLMLAWVDRDRESPGFWGQRSTRVGTNALIATLSVLAILGLLNFLAARTTARLDLSENQVFTLAPETQQLVRNLKQPVKAWVFTPQPNAADRALLESYRRQDDRFLYEFVDPNTQPTLAQQLEVKQPGDVILQVQPNGRKQFVQTVLPSDAEPQPGATAERLSEVRLTSAIAQVTSDRVYTVYFLQGHGEREIEGAGQGTLGQAATRLKDRSFVTKPLNLAANSAVPADANVVVLAGPQKPLLAPEVKALDDYVSQGGSLLFLVDPNTNPKLETLLTRWGVVLGNAVVIDISGTVQQLGPAYSVVLQYGDHPITKDFTNQFSFYYLARPIDFQAVPDVKAVPLLFTGEKSWAESDFKKQPLKFEPPADRPGPIVIGAAFSRPAAAPKPPTSPSPSPSPTLPSLPNANGSPSPSPSPSPAAEGSKEARLVVIGNSSFATDGLFEQAINGDVFINSVRWLSQQDSQALSIRPKEAKNRRITLTDPQANLIGWLAIGILPLLGFGAGFVTWWRRR